MTDRVCFGAAVQPLVRGRATCRILRLPADVARSFAAFGARRAGGEIAGHPVNLALSRAPEGDGLLHWAGKGLPDRLGTKPGPRLDLRLRAAAPDAADAPADLQNALRRAGQTEAWQRLTPGKKRGALYRTDTARTEATRARFSARIVNGQSE
jgi:hypothetical protein